MKARYQYRIYPTDQQRLGLAKLFGCCRVVWNDALALVKSTPDGEKWEPRKAQGDGLRNKRAQIRETIGRRKLEEEYNRYLQELRGEAYVSFRTGDRAETTPGS